MINRGEHEGPCLNFPGQDPEHHDEYDSCYLHMEASGRRWSDLEAEIERLRRELTVREGPYRVGRKLGRTIYNDDEILIGIMDTPELGALVVDALNRCHPPAPETPPQPPVVEIDDGEAREAPETAEAHAAAEDWFAHKRRLPAHLDPKPHPDWIDP